MTEETRNIELKKRKWKFAEHYITQQQYVNATNKLDQYHLIKTQIKNDLNKAIDDTTLTLDKSGVSIKPFDNATKCLAFMTDQEIIILSLDEATELSEYLRCFIEFHKELAKRPIDTPSKNIETSLNEFNNRLAKFVSNRGGVHNDPLKHLVEMVTAFTHDVQVTADSFRIEFSPEMWKFLGLHKIPSNRHTKLGEEIIKHPPEIIKHQPPTLSFCDIEAWVIHYPDRSTHWIRVELK